MKINLFAATSIALLAAGLCCAEVSAKKKGGDAKQEAFPFVMPDEKPDMELSEAMARVYDGWGARTPQQNELYTQFKYSKLEGLDYHNGDGTVTRRDPTRIIKANGKYYMWYTLRQTPVPQGADKATDVIPSTDWDLCDIGYATSLDGFKWTEQGIAVPRPPKPAPGWRSVSTPDVLVYKGKYYLYYQAFSEISGKKGDDCPVAVSWANSPDGPWTPTNKVVVPNGAEGSWDQFSIHDPQPIVFNDKIYLYFKSDYGERGNLIRSTGLAISDDPLGPFVKYEKNPVMNSGHETQMFRFKSGIAAILAKDGHEANTIQFSEDGKNFKIASICENVPVACGVYDPDAFTGVAEAKGITWGISHAHIWGAGRHSIMLRFDCDLSTELNDPWLKKNIGMPGNPEEYLKNKLNPKQKQRAKDAAAADLAK